MQVDDTPAVRALVATLQRICAMLPGAESYVMVHHPAFRVGKKPFAIAGMESHARGATLSVNLGKEAQPGLLDDARFTRTPYIGQHGWVTVEAGALKRGELEALVRESWQRVASTKQRAALRTDASRGAPKSPAAPKSPTPAAKKAAKQAPAKKAAKTARTPRRARPAAPRSPRARR